MKKQNKQNLGINEFINENHRLISVLGIFGALTAFFINLGEEAKNLAGLLFGMFLILCFSVYSKIPKKDELRSSLSYTLLFFESLFWLFVINLFIFFIKKFPSESFKFIFVVLVYISIWISFELKIPNKKLIDLVDKGFDKIEIKTKNKVIYKIIRVTIFISMFVIVLVICNLLTKLILLVFNNK